MYIIPIVSKHVVRLLAKEYVKHKYITPHALNPVTMRTQTRAVTAHCTITRIASRLVPNVQQKENVLLKSITQTALNTAIPKTLPVLLQFTKKPVSNPAITQTKLVHVMQLPIIIRIVFTAAQETIIVLPPSTRKVVTFSA